MNCSPYYGHLGYREPMVKPTARSVFALRKGGDISIYTYRAYNDAKKRKRRN